MASNSGSRVLSIDVVPKFVTRVARASPRVGLGCRLNENQALVVNQTTVRTMKMSGANAKGWNVGPERTCAHPRSAGAGGKIKPATALVLGSVTFMTESPSCNAPGCRRRGWLTWDCRVGARGYVRKPPNVSRKIAIKGYRVDKAGKLVPGLKHLPVNIQLQRRDASAYAPASHIANLHRS